MLEPEPRRLGIFFFSSVCEKFCKPPFQDEEPKFPQLKVTESLLPAVQDLSCSQSLLSEANSCGLALERLPGRRLLHCCQ